MDTQIEFCKASIDPAGNSTTGINRIIGLYGPYCDSEENDIEIKSLISWDPEQYLNVWIADLGCYLLGYASFPNGYYSDPAKKFRDGVVIFYKAFGLSTLLPPYTHGRTLTHEIGHWLNVCHPWGCKINPPPCSGDDVDDTPICDEGSNSEWSHVATNCQPRYECETENAAVPITHRRNVENYMDYSDDECMNEFTNGQKIKMLATLFTVRSSIRLSHGGCIPVIPPHCLNQIKDSLEDGIDCGGSCVACFVIPPSQGYITGCEVGQGFYPITHCYPRHRWLNIYHCLNGATNGPARVMYSHNYNIGTSTFHFTSGRVTLYADCNVNNTPSNYLYLYPIEYGRIKLIDGFKFISSPENEIRFIIAELPNEISQNIECPKSTGTACPSNQIYRIGKVSNDKVTITDPEIETEDIVLYPNPVLDLLNIQINSQITKIIKFEILDQLGRIEFDTELPRSFTIDFYNLPEGIYYLRIITNEKIYVQKIIHVN